MDMDMEEEMMIAMMMVNTRTTTFHEKHHSFSNLIPTPTPTWKLYENPFYTCPQKQSSQYHHPQQEEEEEEEEVDQKKKQIHRLHLPVSTRKIAASFWDLTFIKPFMDSELDTARAQIMELKAQLEYERKARKKAESVNKKLAKELSGERKGREALEKVCEELAVEITSSKSELGRLKIDIEEERKMLRVAEVLREERVQMKLSEAKIMLEEKISELEGTKKTHKYDDDDDHHHHQQQEGGNKSFLLCNENSGVISGNSSKVHGRKVTLEPENPHIKRGIRGFVEFPKVVKAIGSRSRHLGTKLECQKAQLMILLKQQKSQIQANNLIMS